ncbi:MAG: NAD(P)-dependent oxidoreductase [Devosia sp.]|nr:NAD(P)-dependent oxidoreductase [Devosia sp.]
MATIAVTGSTGSKGRGVGPVVVEALRAKGYHVLTLDIRAPEVPDPAFRPVDLTDYGATFAALYGAEAIVHLAANAEPDTNHITGAERFHVNTLAAFNVFQAAAELGVPKVVWASSETVLGYPFDKGDPQVLPIGDDEPAIPTGAYGISKAVTEELARHMHRVYGTNFIGLRLSRIHHDTPGHPHNYEAVRAGWSDPAPLRTNLFGYVDARDVAGAVVAALEAKVTGAEAMSIAAADTTWHKPNEELVQEFYPNTRLRPGTAPYETLISIDKARRLIGYHPLYSWRDRLKG